LVPFLAHIRKARQPQRMKSAQVPIERQITLSKKIATAMGYDLEAGRIDVSAHPFTTSFHPHDVRITTRYNPKNILESIFPTMHEGGHALYEQGLPHEHFGTPLADATSLGIHESQSRLWENMVGKSLPFWKHWYPKLQKEFPGVFTTPLTNFYASVNTVKPTLVRVEADEVTYNLHIIIRFELEKALLEGTIEVRDLPKLWSERYKEYLGITPKSDKEGVLQDVHWSTGYIGYFPTYTLGNLYSAQFWNTAKKQIPDLEKKVAKGDLKTLREWLRTHIHGHGKSYTAEELAQRITGEKLNPDHFSAYIRAKYGPLYGLPTKV
ncbi:MAG: carboxypeptidase M32, partial [bacterium]|nr:carboxypeptidase M32 [bacterium]